MTEDDLTLGGEHTVYYTAHVPWKCALETYMILLTNAAPIQLIKEKENRKRRKTIMLIYMLG